MKKLVLLSLILFILLSGCLDIEPKLSYLDETKSGGTLTLHKLTFGTYLGEAMESAAVQDKPVFVYLRSESCGWCKQFEEETFNNNTVVSKLNQ
ncbi:MAG: DUF255 domain-containing protein, partial [Candidatus Methanoperedens sp.]|nr:DUF255 domain-containing protein [Candidatus Methanoperedens sp.]